jgi:hypothetical protein
MKLLPTRLNQQLSEAVASKAAADLFYISGKSGFWRAIGFGVLGLGLGCAVGLGFYGYSFVARNSDNLNTLASSMSKALSSVQLHATAIGTVDIQPHDISLAKGQTVSFDNNSRILLDPSAKILVDGEVKIQTPTVSIPQTLSPRSKSTTPTISNFTVFKSVPFDKGSINTGWVFLTSAQRTPTSQYCYYRENAENSDVALNINVGFNEQMEPEKNLPTKFDAKTAFSKCVWFKKEGL